MRGESLGVLCPRPHSGACLCPHAPGPALLQVELTDLALPCYVSGMEKPLILGISGKPQGLQVTITVLAEDSESR